MFTVTFYSFKGGVGRTLALVNTAWELASRGKRVFVIDFDLEAPGISVIHPFCESKESPGLVEFVSDYLATGRAPKVEDYTCVVPATNIQGNLWLMRAGKNTGGYQKKFAEIDWTDLYENHQGYLLFEDLKEQINKQFKPDYLLIDSRTGHTDIAGICTRQLPNAVVVMFLPNEQNLAGLNDIVRGIKSEGEGSRRAQIQMLFVPSNVPLLDDEEGILEKRLDSFRNALGYVEPTVVLHHYDSLQLLDREIFIQKRPKSALAKEYRDLTDAIISSNMEDPKAAISALSNTQALLARPDRSNEKGSLADIEATVDEIAQLHSQNGEVLYRIALIRMRLNDWASAESLLTRALEFGYKRAAAYLTRAQARKAQNKQEEAGEDLVSVFRSDDASARELSVASTWLRDTPGSPLSALEGMVNELSFDAEKLLELTYGLIFSRQALRISVMICSRIVNDETASDESRINATIHTAMCEIGLGKFEDARVRLLPLQEQANQLALKGETGPTYLIRAAFNYAMALWGLAGEPPKAEFSTIVIIAPDNKTLTLNYMQCMAVAHAMNGDKETAEAYIARAVMLLASNPKREFSCWRYIEASPREFLEDLEEITHLTKGENRQPKFLKYQPELFH